MYKHQCLQTREWVIRGTQMSVQVCTHVRLEVTVMCLRVLITAPICVHTTCSMCSISTIGLGLLGVLDDTP